MSITTRSPRNIDFALKTTSPQVGPGSYNLPELITTPYESPYPFNTTAVAKTDTNTNPGPAYYDPYVPRLDIHGGVSSFNSKSPRKSWDISNNPSPAEHSNMRDWAKIKSPSHRERMSSKSVRDGALINPQFHKTSAADFDTRLPYDRSVTIPKTARTSKRQFATPGPGKYNISKERTFDHNMSPAFMSHEERDIFKQPDWIADYDGIGQEQWKLPSVGAPFGSRQRRRHFWKNTHNPSPCQYNVTSPRSFKKMAVPFLSGSNRPGLWNGDNNPGPADYKIEHKRRYKDLGDAAFMQRSARFVEKKPEYDACIGQYELDTADKVKASHLREKPSPAFKAEYNRDFFKDTTKSPGVGTYTISNSMKNHKLKHSIDCSERTKPNTIFGQPIPETPGPAKYYNPNDERISGGFMARDGRKRPPQPGPEETPGPVAYVSESSMVKPSYNVTYSTTKL